MESRAASGGDFSKDAASPLSAWPIMTTLAATHSATVALALVCAALLVLAGYSSVNAPPSPWTRGGSG